MLYKGSLKFHHIDVFGDVFYYLDPLEELLVYLIANGVDSGLTFELVWEEIFKKAYWLDSLP